MMRAQQRRQERFLWQHSLRNRRYLGGWLLAALLGCWFINLLPRPLFNVPYATTVYDRNGQLLGARIAADGQWRFPPDKDQLNPKYVTALVTYEDKRFYRHCGVDMLALGRAVRQNLQRKRIVSGASTLSMQTIRLARNRPRTFWEKGVEMLWAVRMECSYRKEDILRLYAAHAPFGGNIVGLEAASWRYFNHESKELSWAEAALLAVLPNAPSYIRPGKNNPLLKSKRDELLNKLLENHCISRDEWALAVEEALPATVYSLPQTAPHLVSHCYQTTPGQAVKTTIAMDMQVLLEQLVERWSQQLEKAHIHNLAVIITETAGGKVAAYCGNSPHDSKTGAVDIIRSPRSSGSILKPFLYAAAMQDGHMLPHTLLADIPVNLNGFSPHNFNYLYDGAVAADKALSRSLNVPMVLLLKKYGVPKFYRFLHEAGFTTLNRSTEDYGLSLILGGGEVTLWDLAQAYTAMADAILGLPQQRLRLREDEAPEIWGKGPFTPSAAWLTFEALKELNRPEEIDWKEIPSMQPVAWKTGTSFGFRDAWAVGATASYVVAVWVGNATGEGNAALIGAKTAGPVLFDVFNFLPQSPWFTQPDERHFVRAGVCPLSGHLKGRFCPEADTILICPKGLRTKPCPYHMPVQNTQGEAQSVFRLPPAWGWYYQQNHPEYAAQNQCAASGEHMPMQFLYPTGRYASVSLPEQWDGSPGSVTLELVHEKNDATVFWHVDGHYRASTRYIHKLTLHLEKGRHRITAIDEEEHRQEVILKVE